MCVVAIVTACCNLVKKGGGGGHVAHRYHDIPYISERGCHTCCAHTPEMPNSHKTPSRQEAGQATGVRRQVCQ